MSKVRILVADDSALMRNAISAMIRTDASLEVIDTARNGQEALDKAKSLRPDVITLDIEMPVMDGRQALKRILKETVEPRPAVLVCSTLTKNGSHEALEALRNGASDVICKESGPGGDLTRLRDQLIAKIKAIAATRRTRQVRALTGATTPARRSADVRLDPSAFDLLVIGCSTGGPPALEQILTGLPPGLCVPGLVAQHMPPTFTRSLAERLDGLSAITVLEGEDGMPLVPGTVCIAPGGRQTRVVRRAGRLMVQVNDEPATALYKPCVNVLFESAAAAVGARCVAVVLTGMGDDGKLGCEVLKAKGATVLTQDEESCVVYGMPKAVAQAGLSSASLNPGELARTLARLDHSAPPELRGRLAG